MKKLNFLMLTLLISLMSFGQSSPEDIIGKWKGTDGKIVNISKLNKELIGMDDKGKTIFHDFHLEKGVWFATSSTASAACEFSVEGNKLELIVRLGLFKKSFSFIKV